VVARWLLLAAACIAIAVAVTAVRPRTTPGPPSRDFEAYWAAGATWNDRGDPYGRAIWNAERRVAGVDARWNETLPFIGPPHTLPAWSLTARLPYERAVPIWWSVLGVALLTLVATSLLAAGTPLGVPAFAGGLVLAVSFAPVSSDLALGQIALPAFAGALLVVVLAQPSWIAAAFAVPLAFAQPNVALGLASQLGRNRTTLAIAAGAAVTYGIGAYAYGWTWPIGYARALVEHRAAERFVAIQFDPASIAFALGAPRQAAVSIGMIAGLLAIAAATAVCVVVRDRFARFAAVSALVPFVAFFFHEHDFVVAFAAAIWCAVRTSGTTRVLALVGTLLAGFDWLGLAQRPTGVAQSALLAAAAFAAFASLGEHVDLRRLVPVALGFAAMVASAAFLAAGHPVPIWPDALSGLQIPRAATIATVWLAEQRASGLLAAVPAWGLLRCFSLLGCALLACAIYRHSSSRQTA